MKGKLRKKRLQVLKNMIQDKAPDEEVEQVLVKFCARNGVSLDTCRGYYQHLILIGEIKET